MQSDGFAGWPNFSKDPHKAALELIEGCYDIIEISEAKTPAQIHWKQAWLVKAKELGASPEW